MKLSLVDNWTKLWKSYSQVANMANILQALSFGLMSFLGVVSPYFAMKTVIGLAILFSGLGFVGRLIKQPKVSSEGGSV